MDAITTYKGILAAEANGFHLNEEIANDVLRESLFAGGGAARGSRSGALSPLMKSEDEITDADREWAETHICVVDNKKIDMDYLNYLAKKYAEAKKKNPDIPFGGF